MVYILRELIINYRKECPMSDYNCPDCTTELNEISGCGSVNYFCNECKKLISKSRVVSCDEPEEEA